jgi:hypothetical protein
MPETEIRAKTGGIAKIYPASGMHRFFDKS